MSGQFNDLFFQGRRIVEPLNPMPAHKTPAKQGVSDLLRGMPRDEPLQHDLLYWLIYWHPRRDEKIRDRRIRHFIVRSHMRSYALLVVLDNGVEVDFSYPMSIDNFYGVDPAVKALNDYRRDVQQAMRYAVLPDLYQWKYDHRQDRPSEDAVVDHVFPYTFAFLSESFLRRWSAWVRYGRRDGWDFDDLMVRADGEWIEEIFYPVEIVEGTRQTLFMPTLADKDMSSYWQSFHRQHASVRWLTPEQNGRCGCLRDAFPEIVGSCLV